MLNSSNYQSDSQVLNSGEEIITDAAEFADPNAKTYYHVVKGACTHMPDGAQITFQGGCFVTANKEIQAYLDKIANKKGSMVYTKDEVKQQYTKERHDAAMTAALPAADALVKNLDGTSGMDMTKQLDETKLVETPTIPEEKSRVRPA